MIVGVGIDAVDIDRIDRMLADKGDRMLKRLFTPGELSYFATKSAPGQHVAVRLAAKEAAYKALAGNELARGIGWRDVEVFSRPRSRDPRRRRSPARTAGKARAHRPAGRPRSACGPARKERGSGPVQRCRQ